MTQRVVRTLSAFTLVMLLVAWTWVGLVAWTWWGQLGLVVASLPFLILFVRIIQRRDEAKRHATASHEDVLRRRIVDPIITGSLRETRRLR